MFISSNLVHLKNAKIIWDENLLRISIVLRGNNQMESWIFLQLRKLQNHFCGCWKEKYAWLCMLLHDFWISPIISKVVEEFIPLLPSSPSSLHSQQKEKTSWLKIPLFIVLNYCTTWWLNSKSYSVSSSPNCGLAKFRQYALHTW